MERIAVITGASKGIGKVTAIELAKKGINVCLLARNYQRCKQTAKFIEEKYNVKALPLKVDLGKDEDVRNAVNTIIDTFKRIDYLINFAGYVLDLEIWKKKVHELDNKTILDIFQIDFMGSFRMAKACLPYMMEQNYGVIINISSTPAISGDIEGAAYSFAKSSLISLSKFIARTYGTYNIRAYTIALGSIMTRATYAKLSKKERKQLAEETALKRWGRPEEIARLVSALISEDFSFVTGQTIIADGGVILY